MKYVIEIDTTNEAFEERPGAEIARILRVLADRILTTDYYAEELIATRLRDRNGNAVGFACHGDPAELHNFGTDAEKVTGRGSWLFPSP
jgi:hypothetical protein